MGLIDKIASAVVTDLIEDAAIGALGATVKAVETVGKGAEAVTGAVNRAVDKTLGDKATRHYRKELKYLSKNPENMHLIIQKTSLKKDIFSIYDTNEEAVFSVHGRLSTAKVNLQLFDSQGDLIGTIKKTAISLRMPVFHESKPADYQIEIDGERVATLKTKLSLNQENYEIEPYGWIVKGNILKWDFTVLDGEDEIVHISKRKGYDSPTYILDFPNPNHEIIGLLIVLAIICRE